MTDQDVTRSNARTGERAADKDGFVGGAHRDPEPKASLPAILRELRHGEEGRALARLARDVHVLRGCAEWRRREAQVGLVAADKPRIAPAGDCRGAGVRRRWRRSRRRVREVRRAYVTAKGVREQMRWEAKADDRYCDTPHKY